MKLSKFERSQKAHYKLHMEHITKSIANPHSELKADYHNDVVTIQRKAGKILPKKERRILYKYNQQGIFGKPKRGKTVKRNDYLSIFRKYKVDSY